MSFVCTEKSVTVQKSLSSAKSPINVGSGEGLVVPVTVVLRQDLAKSVLHLLHSLG